MNNITPKSAERKFREALASYDACSGPSVKLGPASILSGFNIYHKSTVICQEVDLGAFVNVRIGRTEAEFVQRFKERFQGLQTEPFAKGGLPDAFLNRLGSAEGVPFVEVLLHGILAVEASMARSLKLFSGNGISRILVSPTSDQAVLVWNCRVPEVSRRVAKVSLIGIGELLPEELRCYLDPQEEGFKAAHRSLSRDARQLRLAGNQPYVVEAAERKGIPWDLIGSGIMRLGQGKFQHLLRSSAMTENTSHVAHRIARDKQATNSILADIGLPIPRQAKPVNVEEALIAAETMGYPVVVKPLRGHCGQGVSAGLRSPDEIPAAFERASQQGEVIVESFVEGQDHRILIVDGKYVAALKRIPPFVTGDGKKTIGELIKRLNAHRLRDEIRLCQVVVDYELNRFLHDAGYRLDTVLGKDETFILRSMANVSTGGTTIDETDRVHPDNREMAIRASVAIGLDVAGIDFLTTDISRSYKEIGGGIVELNSGPGISIHIFPTEGEPRDANGAMVEAMFPPGDQSRVPVALVVGGQQPGSVAHALDRILRSAGKTVAQVTRNGVLLNGEPTGVQGARHYEATRLALRDRRVETLIDTVVPSRVVREGLGYDLCDTAAITGIETNGDGEGTQRGLEVIIRATRGNLVIGAYAAKALEMLGDVDTNRLVLVSGNINNAVVRRHLNAGGQAVVIARDHGKRVIAMLDSEETVWSIPVEAVSAIADDRSGRYLNALLFAVALAPGMGLSGDEIPSLLG